MFAKFFKNTIQFYIQITCTHTVIDVFEYGL